MHTHQCFQGGEDWNFHRHSSGRQRKWKSMSDVGGPLKRCKQQPQLSGSISLRGLCVLLSIAGQSFSPLRAEMIQRQPPNYAFHSDNAKPLQHTRAGPRRVGGRKKRNQTRRSVLCAARLPTRQQIKHVRLKSNRSSGAQSNGLIISPLCKYLQWCGGNQSDWFSGVGFCTSSHQHKSLSCVSSAGQA